MPIVIPSLNPEAVKPIFSILIGTSEADLLLSMIQIIFILWLLICVSYCVFIYYKKQYSRPLMALLAMVAIALVLPPLMCFSVYFCLWHSRGHIARLWHSLQQNQRLATVQEAIVYTLLSWISAVLFFFISVGLLAILYCK